MHDFTKVGQTCAIRGHEQVDTIECESAEAALATLLIGGREVAMIFADVRLRGVMDGIDLAREVKMRWPLLPVILTSGHPRERVKRPRCCYTFACVGVPSVASVS